MQTLTANTSKVSAHASDDIMSYMTSLTGVKTKVAELVEA